MRIFARETTNERPAFQFFTVNRDADGALIFQLVEQKSEEAKGKESIELHGRLVVEPKALFKQRTFFSIFGINTVKPDGKSMITLSEPMDSLIRERGFAEDLFLREVLTLLGTKPLVVIYFHDAKEDMTIMINKDVNTEGSNITFERAPFGKTLVEIIQEEKPEFAAQYSIFQAREKMLRACNPNASLAYMEAQLDILTRLVLVILESNPSQKADAVNVLPQLQEFIYTINKTSLLNIKPFDKCLAEITETKTKLRNFQTEYYAEKKKMS